VQYTSGFSFKKKALTCHKKIACLKIAFARAAGLANMRMRKLVQVVRDKLVIYYNYRKLRRGKNYFIMYCVFG